MASRPTLHPGQRALAFDTVELSTAVDELSTAVDSEQSIGQMRLFPAPATTVTPLNPGSPSTGQIGSHGENHFEGVCGVLGVPCVRQPPGNEGFDFRVNTWRVEVKSTSKIQQSGRLTFKAGGGRRFADYAGRTDYFAFVVLGPTADLWGRILILSIDSVLMHWRGSHVALRPAEFPKLPDLSVLGGQSLAATAGAEARSGGGELVALARRQNSQICREI